MNKKPPPLSWEWGTGGGEVERDGKRALFLINRFFYE